MAVLATLLVPLPAGAAPTGSIVYIADHNVWLMSADGSKHHQVTSDGSSSHSYQHPSMSSDGTIYAVVNKAEGAQQTRGFIHRMDQGGTLLQPPFAPPQPSKGEPNVYRTYGLEEARISPDGKLLAYVPFYQCGPDFQTVCYFTLFVRADGTSGAPNAGNMSFHRSPSWVTNTQLLVSEDLRRVAYYTVGSTGEPTTWLGDPEDDYGAAVSRAAGKIIWLRQAYDAAADRWTNELLFGTTSGPPGAVTEECVAKGPAGDFRRLGWSPAGDAMVWEESSVTDGPFEGEGVWLSDVGNYAGSNCGAIRNYRLVVEGASSPHWSAAPFAPPGGGGGAPPPGAGPGHGFDDDPSTTQRVQAGNGTSAAVAISRMRFGDGSRTYTGAHATAAHVVLSRDDAFPDSLAGSTLTADGPLLFTRTSELTAETRAEISRVLAPGGLVYLLGGVNAINASVEDALKADGFRTRRLAGASRVETAIEVAKEVRRLYPDVRRVGLARAFGTADNPTAGWADSVTGGGWAASTGVPLLVTPTDKVHGAVGAWLAADKPSETVLFGGTAALSGAVEGAVPNPRRVSASERAGTAAAIARQLWKTPETGARRFLVIQGYRDDGWAFGLAAGGLAADSSAPLVLVHSSVPSATASLVTSCVEPEVDLHIVGDTSVISEATRAELDALDPAAC